MTRTSTLHFIQSLLVCLLLAFAFSGTGCDTFGSDDSDDEPDWAGNWEAVDAKPDRVEFPPNGVRILYTLTTDSITTHFESDNFGCDTETAEIDDVDGNVITAIEDEDEMDPDTTKTRLETSNDTLTITPIETETEIEEIKAESIDSDPASILDCPDASESVQLKNQGPWGQ